MTPNASRRRRQRRRGGALPRVALAGMAALGLGGFVAFGVGYDLLDITPPTLDQLDSVKLGENTKVFDRNGDRIGVLAAERNRTAIRWTDIPNTLRDATVAIEDKRFWDHEGIDYSRIASAAVKNAQAGAATQGGSTITMQVAKNLYSDDKALTDRTFSRKIQEALIAKEIERKNTKEEILTKYLNGVFYGRNAVGVEAAAQTFFKRHASELTLAQSALLAGLPQAPSRYDPFKNPDSAKRRRNNVLDQMAEQEYITREIAEQAKRSGLGLKRGISIYTQRQQGSEYFFEFVRTQLRTQYGKRRAAEGGYRVDTTIDPLYQTWAREAMQANLGQPDDPEAAIVLIDAKTGFIRAMQSKTPFSSTSQFNFAASGIGRQPGSTFKTFTLAEMVRQGIDPDVTVYSSRRLDFVDDRYGKIDVETYSGRYSGPMTVRRATLSSDNSVYTQMILDVTPEKVVDLAYRMGIPRSRKLKPFPSLALGGFEVTPLDMAVAYAPLANGGFQVTPTAIRQIRGPGVGKKNPFSRQRRKIFADGVAYEVTSILRDNMTGGTGGFANISGIPAAGKTGTTDNFVDAWFVGYTPELVAAVWVGYPNNTGVKRTLQGLRGGGQGGNMPARIWHDFMVKVTANRGAVDFPLPADPVDWQKFESKFVKQARAAQAAAASSASTETTTTKSPTPKPRPAPDLSAPDQPDPVPQTTPAAPPTPAPTPDPIPAPTPDPPVAPTPTPAPIPEPPVAPEPQAPPVPPPPP